VTFVAVAFLCLPTMLQIEPHPQRAEALRVVGPADAPGGRGAGSRRRGARSTQVATSAPRPFYGALREGLPSELETLQGGLRARNADAVRQDLEIENPQVGSFVIPASTSSTPSPFPGLSPPSLPGDPAIGVIAGPQPVTPTTPPTTPGTPTPPVIDPIIAPPIVTPPVTTPTGPTVITPPDNPTVSPPVVIDPPGPPTIDPLPPTIDGGTPDPVNAGLPGIGVLTSGDSGGPSGAVPEPSVWMELILGAGLAGAALRRRARLKVGLAVA
jgi:hypothetical protein